MFTIKISSFPLVEQLLKQKQKKTKQKTKMVLTYINIYTTKTYIQTTGKAINLDTYLNKSLYIYILQ